MNFIDKVIKVIDPVKAMKREHARAKLSIWENFSNSGYDRGGASSKKKALKGWNPNSKSSQEDIGNNLDKLRQRSRDLYMTTTLARSAINTNKINIVGAGLKLKPKVDYKTLGIDKDNADKWEKKTEKEFEIWASSKWADVLRLNNFYELQSLSLMSWLMNGDVFPIIKRDKTTDWMPYSLRLHLVEGDRISTPNEKRRLNSTGKASNGNYIYNGVEVDKTSGAVVAYYLSNQYPGSYLKGVQTEWKRIRSYGEKTGNPNILHVMEPERCEQYRGVPYLSPVIESLKQVSRYTKAELMAAVIQSFFTAFIKYNGPGNEMPFDQIIPEEDQEDAADPNSYELGAGLINVLEEGEDVVFGDPSRPSNGFEPFINAMTKQIGAALDIPYELLNKAFLSSYSASRAALLEAWKAFKAKRTWFANDFCQPVYEIWLSEAIARGRIIAPGFFNDPAIKKAWTKAEWIGPAPGQVDPVKEVTAAIMRIENGLSTREREAMELNGTNWDDNINQLIREKEILKRFGSQVGDKNDVKNIIDEIIQNEIKGGVEHIE